MLAHSSLPLKFWDEAFLTTTYIINRLPTPSLSNLTPYQILFQKPPTYSHLKVFGCTCFPNLKPYNSHKLQFRFVKRTCLGYSNKHKGYRCLAPYGKIYISWMFYLMKHHLLLLKHPLYYLHHLHHLL